MAKSGARGNQYVDVKIIVPKNLDSKAKEKSRERDTTNTVKIGRETFPVKFIKNRKFAEMEWGNLRKAAQDLDRDLWPDFRGLRGNLYLKGKPAVKNTKIQTLLKIVLNIHPQKDLIYGFPKKDYDINSRTQITDLIRNLSYILKLDQGGKRKQTSFGFISLHTDWKGRFWFQKTGSFNAAVSESLNAMEILVDELPEDISSEFWEILNGLYRKLDSIYTL